MELKKIVYENVFLASENLVKYQSEIRAYQKTQGT